MRTFQYCNAGTVQLVKLIRGCTSPSKGQTPRHSRPCTNWWFPPRLVLTMLPLQPGPASLIQTSKSKRIRGALLLVLSLFSVKPQNFLGQVLLTPLFASAETKVQRGSLPSQGHKSKWFKPRQSNCRAQTINICSFLPSSHVSHLSSCCCSKALSHTSLAYLNAISSLNPVESPTALSFCSTQQFFLCFMVLFIVIYCS